MDINFKSHEQDIKDWIEGSLSDAITKEATGYYINFEYSKDGSDDENFDDSICFLEVSISDNLFRLTRPMKYSEVIALRDYLNVVIKAHKQIHLERVKE